MIFNILYFFCKYTCLLRYQTSLLQELNFGTQVCYPHRAIECYYLYFLIFSSNYKRFWRNFIISIKTTIDKFVSGRPSSDLLNFFLQVRFFGYPERVWHIYNFFRIKLMTFRIVICYNIIYLSKLSPHSPSN